MRFWKVKQLGVLLLYSTFFSLNFSLNNIQQEMLTTLSSSLTLPQQNTFPKTIWRKLRKFTAVGDLGPRATDTTGRRRRRPRTSWGPTPRPCPPVCSTSWPTRRGASCLKSISVSTKCSGKENQKEGEIISDVNCVVFRNETLDATHLAEFHQIEGVIADRQGELEGGSNWST